MVGSSFVAEALTLLKELVSFVSQIDLLASLTSVWDVGKDCCTSQLMTFRMVVLKMLVNSAVVPAFYTSIPQRLIFIKWPLDRSVELTS